MLVYLWSVQRNYPPAKDWAIGSVMFAIGLFLFALRNLAPVELTEIVSNLFLLPGLMLLNFWYRQSHRPKATAHFWAGVMCRGH